MNPIGGRRQFLRSACRHCLGFSALTWTGLAQAESADAMPERLGRPAADSEEGGLWALMDREEARMRRSAFLVRDAQLGAYLQQLVCRLGGDHCLDVRIQVVRTPQFNASMAPNGLLQVWTGLLLRIENEAQLAAVLGHELGHYIERHTLERMQALKSRAALTTFLSAFGLAGALAGVGVLATQFAFTRDQERRADRIGALLMRRAGFDPAHAAQVWDNLLGELKVTGGEEAGKRSPMFAGHPPAEDRRDALRQMSDGSGAAGGEQFQRLIAPYRLGWLQEELRRGQYEESLVLFDRLLGRNPQDSEVLYARGELRRLRNGPDDLPAAIADLARAVHGPNVPIDALRSLGLAHKKAGNGPDAATAFERYLALAPEAGDAALVKSYLSELRP